jgi:hypothetical protein
MMNETNIQQQRIDVLNETIAIMNRRMLTKDEHRQHLNETIESQAIQLERQYKEVQELKEMIKSLSNKLNTIKL